MFETCFVKMTRHERTLAVLGGTFIALYFLWLTRDALHAYFALDDSGNLFRAWYYPLTELFRANLLFFWTSHFYRPMGSAWYRTIFFFTGYDPVPFHIANLTILLANVWLTYAVSRRLSGSRETGALAALLIAYHPRFAYLYFDTAYIYDVLCYFFYFSTLLFYIRFRVGHRGPNRWELLVCCCLFVCALDSKQMAVTIPLSLVAYELVYIKPSLRSRASILRWLTNEGKFVALSSAMALAYSIGQAIGPDSLLKNPAYQPVFTCDRFTTTSRNFADDLFLQHAKFSFFAVLLLWTTLFVLAWSARSRVLKFSWVFLTFSTLPVAFIDRGAPQYYIPLFGWVLYAATILGVGSRYLLQRATGSMPTWLTNARAPVLFIALGILMFRSYRGTGWPNVPFVSLEGEMLRNVADQMRVVHPTVNRGSRLLFIDDPMGANDLDLMFLARMIYRDQNLETKRIKSNGPLDSKVTASADYIFDYRFGRFFPSVQPRPEGPQPAIAFEWGKPNIYHEDWQRITADSPAQRGELVIAMVTDLGETRPPVPPGKPFPKEPLLDVAGPVDVRIAGKPTPRIAVEIGWPEQMNRYRLDFQIPKDIPAGSAPVVISTSAASGPAIDIPVK
jgi:hypothetical protein